MMFSSVSTAHYLHRHIRSVAKGGSCFSSRRIRRQFRVTITGIFQGLLYFLYGTYYFFDSFIYKFSDHFFISGWISFTATSLYISGTTVNLGIALIGSNIVFVWSLSPSMTSSVWLNFLYYTQIVPAQRALSKWIKKNIKPIIYNICDNSTVNETLSVQMPSTELQRNVLAIVILTFKVYFMFCLCVMVMSSGSTVVYLCKHMHRMAANGQPLTCPRVRSQVRVAITGLLQGALYMFCSIWTVYNYFTVNNSGYSIIDFTVINLYMMGSMFNLGVGQSVFRQRAEDIWLRAVQWCKASKVQQSEQDG
ncbi:uncharacterized protein [Pagrus major]|uniref:uncharacterized protein n=1 Tax=Pagrus major TaxID=143350 RepID=UPI003CC8615C